MRVERTKGAVLAVLTVLAGITHAAAAGQIYVDSDATGSNDGSSWTDAYPWLQEALDTALSGDEIRVAQGTYRPGYGRWATFQLVNGVIMKGGYPGYGEPDPNVRDIDLYETILSGDENSYHVITGSGTNELTVLDGFTITGGNANGRWDDSNKGGGMYNRQGSPTLINCIFRGNSATHDGGGMFNRLGNPTLINCTFSSNSAGWEGGGTKNSGTVYDYISPVLINCRFSGNSAKYGGGVNNSCSNTRLTNCTSAGNSARELGGGMRNSFSNTTVTNCILWANQDREGVCESAQLDQVRDGSGARSVIDYCCIQGWRGNFGGTGNMGAEPLFIDADGADNVLGTEDDNLRLLGGSPCLDAGDNSVVEAATDLDGDPRIIDGTVDMGAYEGANQGLLLSTKSVIVVEGQTATFTVALAMDPQGQVEAAVIHQSGDPDITVQSGGTLTFNSSNYSVPRLVTLAAAEDEDYFHGEALICVSADGLVTVGVSATELDNDAPPVLYVDYNATGANNGASWADAFANLQDAMSVAPMLPEVKEIHVAQGTYNPDRGVNQVRDDRAATFRLINGVALRGGYAGAGEPDPNDRYIGLYETILSGDLDGNDVDVSDPCDLLNDPTRAENSYHVVTGSEADATPVLDGFTISGGNANNVSGESPDRQDRGGGMYSSCSSGSSWQHSDATVINCKFIGNSAIEDGAGMYSCMGSPTVANCTFIGNCARFGGGMYGGDSSATLVNCTFNRNLAIVNGGGIMFGCDDWPTLINCTFTGNSAGEDGGGIWNSDSYGLVMANCILWGNTDDGGMDETAQIGGLYSRVVNYCCVQGWTGGGTGNIDADPLFVDAVNGDFHLKSLGWRWNAEYEDWDFDRVTSRCIDAGNPGAPLRDEPLSVPNDPNNDYGENLRINMGAYGGTPEASIPPYRWALLSDLTNDGIVNWLDFTYVGADWRSTAAERPADLNRTRATDPADLDLLADDWLKTTTWHK